MAWMAPCLRRAQRLLLDSPSQKSLQKCRWLGATASMQQRMHCKTILKDHRLLCTDSTATNSGQISQINPMKIYLQHTFYKGKSALTFQPGKPIFKKDEASGVISLEREGSLFMTFAPSTGPRQYDWSRKQLFALSTVELGGLVSLTTSDSVEYFHDPHLGSSNAGVVRKCLKVEGMPDKSGFFFNLLVSNKLENIDERFSVPVTKAEFAVLRSSSTFIIPYLMGWHALVNPASIQVGVPNKVNSELEWAK